MIIKIKISLFPKNLIAQKVTNKIFIKRIYRKDNSIEKNKYQAEKMILITIFLYPVQETNKDNRN